MLCALTVRRLKPGTLDDLMKVWAPEGEAPPGWKATYTIRNAEDENEIISFGFFDGSLDDLRRSQQELDYAGERAKTDEFVESVSADGIYEVVSEPRA
jgi:hypothetical protein